MRRILEPGMFPDVQRPYDMRLEGRRGWDGGDVSAVGRGGVIVIGGRFT